MSPMRVPAYMLPHRHSHCVWQLPLCVPAPIVHSHCPHGQPHGHALQQVQEHQEGEVPQLVPDARHLLGALLGGRRGLVCRHPVAVGVETVGGLQRGTIRLPCVQAIFSI